MAASTLPVALTHAESLGLRRRIEAAIAEAQAGFLRETVICDDKGVPLGGPDPRAVEAETTLTLARLLAARGLDLAGAAAWEEKLRCLETELGDHLAVLDPIAARR